MSNRKRIYDRACQVHSLWKVRFQKMLKTSWDDDAEVEKFFNDLRRLQYHIMRTRFEKSILSSGY